MPPIALEALALRAWCPIRSLPPTCQRSIKKLKLPLTHPPRGVFAAFHQRSSLSAFVSRVLRTPSTVLSATETSRDCCLCHRDKSGLFFLKYGYRAMCNQIIAVQKKTESALADTLLPAFLYLPLCAFDEHAHARPREKVLRKTLRYYSLNSSEGAKHGGVVGASGVESSLNSFGLYPERREIEGACGVLCSAVLGVHEERGLLDEGLACV